MKNIEKLTESEEVVMKAAWDYEKEPELKNVVQRVNDVYGKSWKPQTVSTFLGKLVKKGYLKMQRNGKIYTYKVLVSEEVYNREQLRHLYFFLYKNDKEVLQRDMEEL